MRSPNCIQILLQVRLQREHVEEQKLTAILQQLKIAEAELANLSLELRQITARRLGEIHYIAANTHHQAVEAHSRALWQRCADQVGEINKLQEAHSLQMSAYLFAHRDREVMENLNKRRCDALEAERRLREQKLNEDLFLARRGARWDI
jgi:hypothetical protein